MSIGQGFTSGLSAGTNILENRRLRQTAQVQADLQRQQMANAMRQEALGQFQDVQKGLIDEVKAGAPLASVMALLGKPSFQALISDQARRMGVPAEQAMGQLRDRLNVATTPQQAGEAAGLERLAEQAGGGAAAAALAESATTEARIMAEAAAETATLEERAAAAERMAEAAATGRAAGAPPETVRTKVFQMPDGSLKPVMATDAQGIADLMNQGGFEVSVTYQPTAPSQFGAATPGGAEDRTTARQVREAIGNLQEGISRTQQSLEAIQAAPENVGISGYLIENVGGVVQQLPGGQAVLDLIDVDPAAAAAIRSDARTLISTQLEQITGDTSGRYTDTERRIAGEALKTLTPESSFEQIKAAGERYLEVARESRSREVQRLMSLSNIDTEGLATEEGAQKLYNVLLENGYSPEEALDTIVDVANRLGVRY